MGETQSFCFRRKRESPVDVLDWVRDAAKRPCSLSTVTMRPDQTKSNCHVVEEPPFSLALQFREAMYAKLFYPSRIDDTVSQKRQKMNPSMYDDDPEISSRTSGNLRCSKRILSEEETTLASCSEGFIDPDDGPEKDLMEYGSKGTDDNQRHSRLRALSRIAGIHSAKDRKHIRIGPEYQVQIPEWSSRASSNSDDPNAEKFLGKRLWPPGRPEQKSTPVRDPLGQGGLGTCCCARRGCMECARFHVAEKRIHLKRELGSAFYGLGFDHMGEEVSLAWTAEEEEEFMAMDFWDRLFLCFASKTRQVLVSYYFNVFILRRSRYQNRRPPKGAAVMTTTTAAAARGLA
ncbi:unnamed protein product [Spirodela intermedia]|uniref:ELM2 domain-containing protein n=1 Tax=Spirodela intermedia TaxID=51605 RepID=A0A7I8IF53_SPIIN|nr:unnamed protein product [Spirodela intermedia]CAA6655492.1 unnamed protein product [Spirodela intermedia]